MNAIEGLDAIVAGTVQPGVYRVASSARADELDDLLAGAGWRSFYLDGRLIQDKRALLAWLAVALDFPAYVGRNWDALEEAVRDLSWVPAAGYLLVYDYPQVFAAQYPQEWRTLLSILRAAVDEWQARDIPFIVLLGETEAGLENVEWLGG